MSFEIDLLTKVSNSEVRINRRLYLDKNGNVAEAGNPASASLLVPEGGMMTIEEAERYGLFDVEGAIAEEEEEEEGNEEESDEEEDSEEEDLEEEEDSEEEEEEEPEPRRRGRPRK